MSNVLTIRVIRTTMRRPEVAATYSSGEAISSAKSYSAFHDALHNESAWASRSYIPFQFFFGKTLKL